VEAIRQAAAAAARPAEVEDPVDDGRKPWDTGPILSAARNGLYKTLRTVTGRTAEREPASA
jgi:hypothetical protein